MVTRMMKSLVELVPSGQSSARCILLEHDIVCADNLRYDAAQKQFPLFPGKFFETLFYGK
jgi:hypothetical protein